MEDGPYAGRAGVDVWGISRDARLYRGPDPVVCHPPCTLWINLAAVNWKRYGHTLPAWYPGGSDDGCFAAALSCTLALGGVLEHPADSHAWDSYYLPRPRHGEWTGHWRDGQRVWVCEVWQSAYGHEARKRTWLLYVGQSAPAPLLWHRTQGTHQCGHFDKNRPPLRPRDMALTPPLFADALIGLASSCRM